MTAQKVPCRPKLEPNWVKFGPQDVYSKKKGAIFFDKNVNAISFLREIKHIFCNYFLQFVQEVIQLRELGIQVPCCISTIYDTIKQVFALGHH